MASSINAITTGVGGIVSTGDNSGDLNIQSGGSTKIAVTSSGVTVTGLAKASLPTGSVLQVVTKTDTASLATSSTSFVATGTFNTITPLYSTSKILIIITAYVDNNASGRSAHATIYRNSTELSGTANGFTGIYGSASRNNSGVSLVFTDSPSTTSSVRYEAYVRSSGGAGQIEWNGSSIANTVTLMEIAA
jgi:hypothetical protein